MVTVSKPVPLTPSSPNTSQSRHVHLGSSIIPFLVLCVLRPMLSAYDVDLIGFVIKEMPNGGPVSRPPRLPNVPVLQTLRLREVASVGASVRERACERCVCAKTRIDSVSTRGSVHNTEGARELTMTI
jgi:hypothetical protein